MYAIQNRQYNLALIELVELVDDMITAESPEGEDREYFALDLHMVSGVIHRILFDNDEDRMARWESLINAIENEAGLRNAR